MLKIYTRRTLIRRNLITFYTKYFSDILPYNEIKISLLNVELKQKKDIQTMRISTVCLASIEKTQKNLTLKFNNEIKLYTHFE